MIIQAQSPSKYFGEAKGVGSAAPSDSSEWTAGVAGYQERQQFLRDPDGSLKTGVMLLGHTSALTLTVRSNSPNIGHIYIYTDLYTCVYVYIYICVYRVQGFYLWIQFCVVQIPCISALGPLGAL